MWVPWLVLLASMIGSGGVPPTGAAPVAVVDYHSAEDWTLDGIGLGEGSSQVMAAWGRPSSINKDELQQECETWSYKDGKNVGLCDGQVTYVQVTAKSAHAVVGDRTVAMEPRQLRKEFGNPAFEAEDGWGVTRGDGEEAFKVFVDNRGKLVSLDLFYGPCGV
jgi:hypothetical protein